MNYLSVEYLIVYAFLGITALVGLGGLRMKAVSGSFREYATADKRLGVGALAMTLLATFTGAWNTLVFTTEVWEIGFEAIIRMFLFLVIPAFSLTTFFIAPKIVHFKDCMTTGDLMKLFYGEKARIITGLLSSYFCACLCAMQFVWMGRIIEVFGFDSFWALVIGGGFLGAYTVMGGMRSVVLTDILHFVVVAAAIPLLAHLLLYQAGGFQEVLSTLNQEQKLLRLTFRKVILGAASSNFLGDLFIFYSLSFPFIQRMLMAKHQQQIRGMYRAAAAFTIPFYIVLALIGLVAASLYSRQDLTSPYILVHIANTLPPVGRGLVLVAILCVIISTADSFLHATGIALVHDTFKPLAAKWGITFNELRTARYSVVFITVLSLLMCFLPDALDVIVYAHFICAALFTISLAGGIIGLKTDSRHFYISAISSFLVFLFFTVVVKNHSQGLDFTILTSLFTYLGAHYYTNGGFATVNRSQYGQTTTVWHPSWQGARTTLASLIPTPQKVVRYFQQRVAENSSNTTTLALFVAVSYMVPLFIHSIGHPDAYAWLLVLRIVGALLCVGLLLKSQWPTFLLRFFPTFYHLTLLWCFPFMTSFLFFLEGGTIAWVMNVMLAVMLFIMLLDYMTAVGLSIAGIALAMMVYRVGIGTLDLSMSVDMQYMLAYGMSFSIIIGVLFSRLRERLLRQANHRLVHQEAALEAHFPAVMAESERRTRAFQQMGVKGFLHTARKLHTIQHKTVAAQREQQALFTSLAQRQETLTQRQEALLGSFAEQQVSQAEFLDQQQDLAQQQRALQAEFNTLTQQQLAPQAELTAVDQSQAPQTELQTLAKHHLSPQAELNSLAQQQQDLQADLLPLVMQLQDLDTRGQDHLTLDVNKNLLIDQFLLSLQEKLLPRGIDVPLLIERKTKQQKITVDADQLATLLVKGIASLQWLLHDQDQYLLLGIEDTQLTYPLPDVAEGYVKQVPALRLTLTATEELPPLEASYRPDLTNFIPETHQTFQDMEEEADKRLIKAHYGYTEVSEDTLIYVIPVDVYKVRPLDMDKPELAIGALPERANDHFKHETADAQAQEEAFLKVVSARSDANLGMIKLALNLIKWYHGHKNRHSGEPFYLHPLAVAQIVMDYDQDEATIVGALLHDTVEDTPMLMGHIEALFGKDTAEVVDLVTHLQSIPGSMYKVKLSSEENLKMLGHSENKRGLYVKLADRMHNMRTINGHPKVSKRKLVAQETMDFFVPLAKKLELTEAAAEFEKMCEEVFKQKE